MLVFQALRYNSAKGVEREGLSMLTITNTTIARDEVWRTLRRTHDPEVPTGDDHAKVHVYGAVAPLTGRTHYHIRTELGKGEFARFLQHLLTYYPRKQLLMIHDRGEQHKGAPVQAVIREAGGRLMLKPQPAYSPESNPQERIKSASGNGCAAS
jgi:hypothetical protein